MDIQDAMQQGAESMSAILTKHGVGHAVIGGFATNLLGHSRKTVDVDVEIDVESTADLRGRISDMLTENDARFSVEIFKLFFTPPSCPHLRFVVETLPIGALGLPTQVIRPGNGAVPILRPGVLILTKIKRCATLLESTRPKSAVKYALDLSDILFLLKWLVNHNERVDFVGYQSRNVARLYTAVGDLIRHWKQGGEDELVQLMKSVLEDHDRERIDVG